MDLNEFISMNRKRHTNTKKKENIMKKANKNFLYGDSIIITYAVEEEEFQNGNKRKKNEKSNKK